MYEPRSAETEGTTPLVCIVLVGLQAAGKTTFFERSFLSAFEHISKDRFPNSCNKRRRQAELLEGALSAGRSVVIDNTNPTIADREPVIMLARRHGARVLAYYFEPDTKASVARNRARQGKARVPDVAIFTTAKRMVAPTCAEGFDEVWAVRLGESGAFDLQLICA